MPCVIPLGQDSWKFEPGSFQTLPHVPFPFVDFVLHFSTQINQSCGYDYMLSPVWSMDKQHLHQLGTY